MDSQLYQIQAKKIGLMMTMACRKAGLSTQILEQKTGFGQEELLSIENGSASPSLPQLQIIADVASMSIDELVNTQALDPVPANLDPAAVRKYCEIRNRILAVQIKKNRVQQGLTVEELSEHCGISAADLYAFEAAQKPVSLPVLLKISEVLQLPYVLQQKSEEGPVPAAVVPAPMAEAEQAAEVQEPVAPAAAIEEEIVSLQKGEPSAPQTLIELPGFSDELKEFISKPINLPFLELAMKLSQMDAKKLRDVAESLLEITL